MTMDVWAELGINNEPTEITDLHKRQIARMIANQMIRDGLIKFWLIPPGEHAFQPKWAVRGCVEAYPGKDDQRQLK
jgi:hypothetical protein